VAPEADPGGIDPEVSFHDQFEIDSADYLNIMTSLEARLGLSIPEADDLRISSLQGCLQYLQPKLAEKAKQAAEGSP
jgi:acyl carrier protein